MFSTIQKWETRKKEVTSTNQAQNPVYYGFVCLGPPAVGTVGNLRVQLFQAADAHWSPRSFWLSIDCHTPTLCLRGDLLWRSSLENSLCWHWVWPQHCLKYKWSSSEPTALRGSGLHGWAFSEQALCKVEGALEYWEMGSVHVWKAQNRQTTCGSLSLRPEIWGLSTFPQPRYQSLADLES